MKQIYTEYYVVHNKTTKKYDVLWRGAKIESHISYKKASDRVSALNNKQTEGVKVQIIN